MQKYGYREGFDLMLVIFSYKFCPLIESGKGLNKMLEKLLKYKLGLSLAKLGLDFTLIFCRFGFSGFGLVELVWWISFCMLNLCWYIKTHCLVDLILYCYNFPQDRSSQ